LVHRDRLQQLATLAESAANAGETAAARAHWADALGLVPINSEQHQQISARLAALVEAPDAPPPAATATGQHSWWKPVTGGVVAVAVLVVSKLKFLLLGLTKMSTVLSDVRFIGVLVDPWLAAGRWSCGVDLRSRDGSRRDAATIGINAGAPLFIPGVGALVMLKQHITDPVIDARIGLAGPVWGLSAAVVSWASISRTGTPIWLAIAELTVHQSLQPDSDLAARWRPWVSRPVEPGALDRRRRCRPRAVDHRRTPVVDRRRRVPLSSHPRESRTRPPADGRDVRRTRARVGLVRASSAMTANMGKPEHNTILRR
jgi:hypothetical protein